MLLIFFENVSLFFPHLIYLPQLIVDKKGISVTFKEKDNKIVNWHKAEGFSGVSKDKWWNLYHIKSRIYPTYIFIFSCITFLFGIIFSRNAYTEMV